MNGLIVVMFSLMFLYPLMIFLLLATDLLHYMYNPFWRFGTITVITFITIVFLTRKKYSQRKNDFLEDFSLHSGKVNNIDYFYTYIYNEKHKNSVITTYIEGIYGYDFSFKLEGRLERFFKYIGLNRECQSDDAHFDEDLYISSDDSNVCKQLKENEKLRKFVYEIFYKFKEQNIHVSNIKCFDGRIIVSASSKSEKNNETLAAQFASEIAVLLKEITDLLMSMDTINDRVYREKSSLVTQITLLFSIGLIVNGYIGLMVQKTTVGIIPRLADTVSLTPLAIKLAAVMVLIASIGLFLILRNSSRRSLAILIALTIGFFGSFLSALVEIKEVNMYFDTSKAEIKNYVIQEKEANWYPKHRTVYKLYLTSKNHINDTFYGEVPYDIYAQAAKEKNVLIYYREGFLNYQWIEKIEILN
jgi:hypothetical protein